MLVSPFSVVAGDVVTVLAASETPRSNARLTAKSGGTPLQPSSEVRSASGPPYWWTARFTAPASGAFRVALEHGGATAACVDVRVEARRVKRGSGAGAWKVDRGWDRGMENLYSAWLEHLFWVEEGTSWRSLHEVTRIGQRNLLHNRLGLGEDGEEAGALRLNPDCADNPYFLRAYFAFKVGLPFGFHRCDRGAKGRMPSCTEWVTNDNAGYKSKSPLTGAQRFFNATASGVHSATARTTVTGNDTDLYAVPLTREGLRPGTVYADPYGHTLTIVRWVDQQGDAPGVLLAVDAQPDGTVAVKRFWRGNFLFTTRDVIGAPGFKSFRPIEGRDGALKLLTNKQILRRKGYGNYSQQQSGMETTAFFDAMEKAINPTPLDPVVAYRQVHEAIHEQLLQRVESVRLGEEYMRANPGVTVPMPPGIRIFLTSGPWEDFSTPSRDLRLLTAMDVLTDFPDRVMRTPEAFKIPEGKTARQVAAELRSLHTEWAGRYVVSYVRTDGVSQSLSLTDILQRASGFEVAYNPNDCIEVRWAAPEGSAERASCKRHAPPEQAKAMETCRAWFNQRRRPAW